jgi:hypothetical protein
MKQSFAQIDTDDVNIHGVLLVFYRPTDKGAPELIPGGAARRDERMGRTEHRRQGRAWVWRGTANPCRPAPFCYLSNVDGRRRRESVASFPVVSPRGFSGPANLELPAAEHPISAR